MTVTAQDVEPDRSPRRVGRGMERRGAGEGGDPGLMTMQVVENVLQATAAGLLVGAMYGLMCVGLALIFGVMRVINFAQGDFMMLGMYSAFYLVGALGMQAVLGTTFGPYVAALLAGPVMFVAGYLIHRTLMSRVSGTRAQVEAEGHFAQLILTLGISLVLQNGGLIVFGSVLAGIRRRQLAPPTVPGRFGRSVHPARSSSAASVSTHGAATTCPCRATEAASASEAPATAATNPNVA